MDKVQALKCESDLATLCSKLFRSFTIHLKQNVQALPRGATSSDPLWPLAVLVNHPWRQPCWPHRPPCVCDHVRHVPSSVLCTRSSSSLQCFFPRYFCVHTHFSQISPQVYLLREAVPHHLYLKELPNSYFSLLTHNSRYILVLFFNLFF